MVDWKYCKKILVNTKMLANNDKAGFTAQYLMWGVLT